jgi:RNA polymerase sigma-70 factor (ECF subfamily)
MALFLEKNRRIVEEHLSDIKIIELCLDEESRSYGFNLLVRKYQKRLYFHIRKMVIVHDDADDVLQQTFIKAWKSITLFRGESQLYTWLYRIASNACIDFLKAKQKRNHIDIDQVAESYLNALEEDPLYTGDDMEREFQKALLTLPDKQRLVFNLKYFEELKYEEISQITGTSVGGLKASYHHAVEKIKAFIKQD